ncbi:hypothetical protein BKD09_42035 [Bradyrhizobium japonicum]|uniref:Uncharacterized protein n=1 Tax=Bradyrhizobium japonicum TaxID=375 RepID=A0A1L3FNL1_BRAJP|nr:hypothetical protein BKD09_42035 [Bradyrhizobium japonicum]
MAGLWCVNASHGREEIKVAIAQQLEEMDYVPSFQMRHPKSFELAARHAASRIQREETHSAHSWRLPMRCSITGEVIYLQHWGLDYEALKSSKPQIVRTHLSAYGRTGDRAN